ncbi:hypothetical protein EXIGLDRAFT_53336 [Exidia glandulosa HHB12029]|uniref:Uncharacterized protein n=1 Tax=Exidia glandulosa HHB12029 TaxID=1314781 RepID=A0A165IC78_EXIGL|nr:hypothetical protein EXIGLDRAFT_53336 [Exidia glandulosa HHB12029]
MPRAERRNRVDFCRTQQSQSVVLRCAYSPLYSYFSISSRARASRSGCRRDARRARPFQPRGLSEYALLASSRCYQLLGGPFSDDAAVMEELRDVFRTRPRAATTSRYVYHSQSTLAHAHNALAAANTFDVA